MTTKDEFLKNYSFVNDSFSTVNKNQYSNLNLNQNNKSSILFPVQSCSKSNNDKKYCGKKELLLQSHKKLKIWFQKY
jgi:hypothetical protein